MRDLRAYQNCGLVGDYSAPQLTIGLVDMGEGGYLSLRFPIDEIFLYILFPPADFISIVGICFSFWGVSGLVRTLDTVQGTVWGLDNPAELPLGDSVVPCHKLL